MLPSVFVKSRLEVKGHRFLLVTLFLMILISSLVQRYSNLSWMLSVSLILVLLTAVRTVSDRKDHVQVAFILGILAIIPQFVQFSERIHGYTLVQYGATTMFMFWVCALLLRDIVNRSHTVNMGLILGAINVYLMAAIGFAYTHALIEYLQPGSYTGVEAFANQQGSTLHFLYFSFVTLTTLGFGDISPLTSYAMTATYMEAVFGQLYLVFLVSRLVGMYVGRSLNNNPGPDT